MISMATLGAEETRLALAVPCCCVAAPAALLRRETRVDVDDGRAGRGGFLPGPGGEQAPAGREDRPVQPGFRAGTVREVRPRLVRVRFGFRLPHHARRIELLEHD